MGEIQDKINENRDLYEAGFVMCLWHEPTLYEEYNNLNEGKNITLMMEQSIFYYNLGRAMFRGGYKVFDAGTCAIFVEEHKEYKEKYEYYGGYDEIASCMIASNSDNIEGYYDQITKMNALLNWVEDYRKIITNISQFSDMTHEQVYNYFENINNTIALNTSHAEKIQDLTADDNFIQALKDGANQGFSYNAYAPLLNSITCGAIPSSLYMIGGVSGAGKSSFAFEIFIMGLIKSDSKTKCAIISNEMNIETYKILLLVHVLTRDLNYWGLTRKHISLGQWNTEQTAMIEKARKIIDEKYSGIKFIKMFDNNVNQITKYLKKLKATENIDACLVDTWKSDDDMSDNLWQSLMLNTRKLFRCCDRLKICCFTTYQLALATMNQRYLNATCLSNSKQVKEVYENMVYIRHIFDDEFPEYDADGKITNKKTAISCYKFQQGNNKIREEIKLDKDRDYLLCFVDKTRSDASRQVLIYEWNPRFNWFKELGWAVVKDDYKDRR